MRVRKLMIIMIYMLFSLCNKKFFNEKREKRDLIKRPLKYWIDCVYLVDYRYVCVCVCVYVCVCMFFLKSTAKLLSPLLLRMYREVRGGWVGA